MNLAYADSTKPEAVLILAPTGQDASLIAQVFARDGISAEVHADVASLVGRMKNDAGAIVVAEEALTRQAVEVLNGVLEAQETWSDIPLIVMTSTGETTLMSHRVLKTFAPAGNVTLLERPFRPQTLVSSVQVALRARRRQYQVRELLKRQIEATRVRDEFISIASHELKTPITALKLQTQLSRRSLDRGLPSALDPKSIRRLAERTDQQIDRLSRLVEDMLDISRLETGKLSMRFEEMDLCDAVREVVDSVSGQLAAVDCETEVVAAESLVGRWDRYRIEQVITNLLTNAIRYSPGKPVRVEVRREGNKAVLSVKDQGKGIAPENVERIFERFERAVESSGISGLGLGLYISREIVRAHGGSIRVRSELGQGAEFIVALPLAN